MARTIEYICTECGETNTYHTKNLAKERAILVEYGINKDDKMEVVVNCRFCLVENVINPFEDGKK